MFLVDSSDGVNPISYNKEKAFVKFMAKRLNISPDKSRAAVVAYGSNSRLEIGLDDNNDLPSFNSIMDSMASLGGPRRIDKALEIAANVLNDSRISRPKIVVLLTSGRQPLDAPTLSVSAGKLHTLGAMVFVVSIANDVDPKYFDVLVEDSELVSIVPSFDGLSNALSKLILEIEQGNILYFYDISSGKPGLSRRIALISLELGHYSNTMPTGRFQLIDDAS